MPITRSVNDFKDSVRVSTTGSNITLTGGAPNVLDGVNLALNDGILVKDQANTAENGIYRVTTLGTGSNGTWTRRSDFNDYRQITPGSMLFTEDGTINGNTFYYIRGGIGNVVVDTTGLSFANLSATFGTGGSGYGNTQVGQYLPTHGGNIAASNININGASSTLFTMTSSSVTGGLRANLITTGSGSSSQPLIVFSRTSTSTTGFNGGLAWIKTLTDGSTTTSSITVIGTNNASTPVTQMQFTSPNGYSFTGTGGATTIDTNGNVGVGGISAGSAGYRFALQGYAASAVPLYLHSDATNAYLYSPNPVYMGSTGANPTVLVSNNTERLRIDSGGNVGIGTSSPITQLHLNASGYAAMYLGNNASTGFHVTKESTDNSFNIWAGTFGSGTNRFKVDSGGNVGIGNTSPLNTLSVTGNIYASGNIFIPNASIQTNTIYSSNGNVAYKLDTTTYKRHLFTVNGFDFKNDNGMLTPVNKTRYTNTYTGANASVVVPAGVTAIFVKMWGAGGGGGSYGAWRQGSSGGAGGCSCGIIQVVPAETIVLRVGGRGQARNGATGAWPDGGAASTGAGDNQYAAAAGGSSSIYVPSQAAYVMYAGGGGGGGSVNGWSRNSGGAGGGLIGEPAASNSYNVDGTHSGKGGTQSAGGAAGTGGSSTGQAGSLGQGGTHQNTNCYAGGGGGGFYGGGSGAYNSATSSMGGGGGGSGRIHSSVIMGQTYTGSHHIPPFFEDQDLSLDTAARYARGADESNYGGHGLIVLYY